MTIAHLNLYGLIVTTLAAVLMIFAPPRVVQYTADGSRVATWTTGEARRTRLGRAQDSLWKVAALLLLVGFALQLPSAWVATSAIVPAIVAAPAVAPALEPHWTEYVARVSVPVVALIAAVAAGYIGWRQWGTARDKLKMDLFDRRFDVYSAVTSYLDQFVTRPNDRGDLLLNFVAAIGPAKWLISSEAHAQLAKIPSRMQSAAEQSRNHVQQVRTDVLNELEALFSTFLGLKH